MSRFFYVIRLAVQLLKSRGFALPVMAVLLSMSVYAVNATTYTVYIRADQKTEVKLTSKRELDDILEECGISVSPHDEVDFSGDLTQRAYGNRALPGQVFSADYRIIVNQA